MSQKQYSTTSKKFKHLNEYQRGEIEVMLKRKYPKTQIAKELFRPLTKFVNGQFIYQISKRKHLHVEYIKYTKVRNHKGKRDENVA